MTQRTSSEEKISLAASNTVYTYHCLCTNLLLATTTPLNALATRQNSLDHAHIMPLPPPSTNAPVRRGSNHVPMDHYGLLLSTSDPSPQIITSDDGFEKRYLQRCGRCHLTVGYQLDWEQFQNASEPNSRNGRRDDLVFLLPGGFMTTSEMVMGKTVPASGSAGGGVDIGMGSVTSVKA
ncbi:hypothetical protein B0J11DRAFT_439072 [Dendryphion nanum]|uniref:STEEP1 domain-containing protein n=1 Tax=Dendryphion nanum TaxID=256645 RepID=A0A9P9IIR3_9PLEO|nr:hypothetical protein B0J11DRAFT_439072 [Dendryphion nanum]